MYASMIGTTHVVTIGAWKADLRDYARWEYGTADAANWLLAAARRDRRKRPRAPAIAQRVRSWFRMTATLPPHPAAAPSKNMKG